MKGIQMTVIDEILAANKRFAARVMSDPLLKAPSRAVAVLTCMDTQIAVEQDAYERCGRCTPLSPAS